MMTDKELATRVAVSGDQVAFGLLVERHQQAIRCFLRRMAPDYATADDLAQDTFVAVLRKPFADRGPVAAAAYLRRVARNLGLEFHDCDEELEKRTGASVNLIFDIEGEAGFRKRETGLLAELLADGNRVIATGGGAVLSASNRR